MYTTEMAASKDWRTLSETSHPGQSSASPPTQKEVQRLLNEGIVESAIRFPTARELCYAVASLPFAAEVSVDYIDDSIFVSLPSAAVMEWAGSDQVSIEGPRNSEVQVLVEKDFQCLHKPEERDPDAYPNPLAATKRPAA
jgi:hypothetical protein